VAERITLVRMLAEMRRRVEAVSPADPVHGPHYLCRRIDEWAAEPGLDVGGRRTKAGYRRLREAAEWLAKFGTEDGVG
jgi:hypothetical protein